MGIKDAPPVCVHLARNEAELIKIAVDQHPWMKDQFDRVGEKEEVAGLTVGVNPPAIHVYISDDLDKEYVETTIIHEALHITNCILRYRTHGSMGREKLLIVSDKTEIKLGPFESLKIQIEGMDEEDQAVLVSEVSVQIKKAIKMLKEIHGKEEG